MSLLARLFGRGVPTVTGQEVIRKMDNGESPFLLDVREEDEFEEAHIPGAILIPLGELQQRLNELPKDKEIVCVCRSGSRSAWATQLLTGSGFQASNMQGGMIFWSGPVTRGPS